MHIYVTELTMHSSEPLSDEQLREFGDMLEDFCHEDGHDWIVFNDVPVSSLVYNGPRLVNAPNKPYRGLPLVERGTL